MQERLVLTSDDLTRLEIEQFEEHVITSRAIRFRDRTWSIHVPHLVIDPKHDRKFYRFELTRLDD